MNEFDRQLELKLASAGSENSFQNASKTKPAGANWWFTQMRQVVNRAFDWSSVPAARPVQTYLEGGFIRGIDLATVRKKH
jgi:hypothetical protein